MQKSSKKKEPEFINDPTLSTSATEKTEEKADDKTEDKAEVKVEKKEEAPILSVEPPKPSTVPEIESKKEVEVLPSTPPIEVKTVKPEVNMPVEDLPPAPPQPPISVPLPQAPPPKKSTAIIAAALIAALLLVGGIWYFVSKSQKTEELKEAQILVSPTINQSSPTPTSAATQEAKLDKYSIKILNGSGTVGEAGKVKTILEEEGFKVSSTGNADNYDYKATIIRTKANTDKSFIEKLRDALEKTYAVGKDEALSASESGDVTVIVGSGKAK